MVRDDVLKYLIVIHLCVFFFFDKFAIILFLKHNVVLSLTPMCVIDVVTIMLTRIMLLMLLLI